VRLRLDWCPVSKARCKAHERQNQIPFDFAQDDSAIAFSEILWTRILLASHLFRRKAAERMGRGGLQQIRGRSGSARETWGL
jgi:hypothetical protein